MVLFILRGAFILLVAAVTTLYLGQDFQRETGLSFAQMTALIIGAIAIAATVIGLDVGVKRKRLSSLAGVFLGLVAGLVAAYAAGFVVDLIFVYFAPENPSQRIAFEGLLLGIKVIIGLITCYIAMSFVLQTKDDFRFVIPYVEFAKEIRGHKPTVLDTSVIVDGRVLDIVKTHVLQGTLIAPKFVINELQTIADSADKLKRERGRRGLDVLQKMTDDPAVDLVIQDRDAAGGNTDQKLVSLAAEINGRVMTNDFNLNKVAQLRGVEVVNLNDLAKAMRPVVLPGEPMTVRLVKAGESQAQGVGYLDDGTMVVVEQGRDHIGERVEIIVTSTLQTSAGRMIFGKYTGPERGSSSHKANDEKTDRDDTSHDAANQESQSDPAREPATTPGGAARPRTSSRNPRRSGR